MSEATDFTRNTTKEERGLIEQASSVVVCLFEGCDRELLPMLLQALCDELVSFLRLANILARIVLIGDTTNMYINAKLQDQ